MTIETVAVTRRVMDIKCYVRYARGANLSFYSVDGFFYFQIFVYILDKLQITHMGEKGSTMYLLRRQV